MTVFEWSATLFLVVSIRVTGLDDGFCSHFSRTELSFVSTAQSVGAGGGSVWLWEKGGH